MTVSSTPCCGNAVRAESARGRAGGLRTAARLALLLCLVASSGWALAGKIETLEAGLAAGDEGYVLSAQFHIELGSHLEEAVSRGVPLYFQMEFDLTRNRWYWSNEHVAGRKINYRLAYNALTRQYRLSNGGLHQNFATFGEALRVLARVASLPVADKGALKINESYEAALRLSLDRQQLPKPLQVDAIANRDWEVEAKTQRWAFVPAAPPTEAAGK